MRVLIAILALLSCAPSFAQSAYPDRPIRIVVSFPPGGTTDILARLLASHLSDAWSVPVVVDNRPGASNALGTDLVAKAKPDGYTLGLFISTHAVNPFVSKALPYDTKRDFAPVMLVATVPGIMVMTPELKPRTLAEVVALSKSKPGTYSYGVPGTLSSGHLTMEYIKQLTGADITMIPYKGAAPLIVDLLGGRIEFSVGGIPPVLQHIKDGKLKAIATTGRKRSPILPDVPTVAESGLPGFESYEWYAVFAPSGVPEPILSKLNAELRRIIALPDVRARMLELGAEPGGGDAEALGTFLDAEMAKWGPVAQKLKLND